MTRFAIVVLGMHRSGTSAFTRLMSLLGVTLPRRLISPGADNARGFWEPDEIVKVHEQLLASAGSRWDDVAEFPAQWYASSCNERFKQCLIEVLSFDYAEAELFVVKDPRICRLIPLWRSVLASINAEPRFVIPVRNPLEVAASLKRRNGFPYAKSLLLWLGHLLLAERHTRDAKRAFVSYDALLHDWKAVAEKIGADLELPWPRSINDAHSDIDAFLSNELRHHIVADEELSVREDVVRWVKQIHKIAGDAAKGKEIAAVELDRIYDRFNEASVAFAPYVGALEHDARQRRRELAERDGQTANLNQAVAERDGQLARLNQAVAERDGQLARLNQTVAERDGQIARLNQAVAERDGQIASLTRTVATRNATLGSVYASTSWRLTAPYRWVGHQAKRLRHLWRITPQIAAHSGGLWDACVQAMRAYRSEGLVGVKHWLKQVQAPSQPVDDVSSRAVDNNDDDKKLTHRPTSSLIDAIGVVPSSRPHHENDFAIEVPFSTPQRTARVKRVAVIAHIFYPELAKEMLSYLANIPVTADVFVSTDTEDKKRLLADTFAAYANGRIDIRVLPNRGRDIAPKLVGFADVYIRYEHFLHIHSKRSSHGGKAFAKWRSYLHEHLLGSKEIVESIFELLGREDIGVVFPQHMFEIRGILNWGYDFDLARGLLRRVEVQLEKDMLLEFPSGSMFWGKSSALRPLLDLGLSFESFEDEAGKVDGTLAHAVERAYLYFAEVAGYRWLKIVRRDLYPLSETVLEVRELKDIDDHIAKVYRPLLVRPTYPERSVQRSFPEMRRMLPYPSMGKRARLNLFVPTVNPSQIFGGVASAIRVFEQLRADLESDFDFRIIVTDAHVQTDAIAHYADYQLAELVNSDTGQSPVIVDACERFERYLPIRADDVFIATAWWTAHHAFELMDFQQRFFGSACKLVYLIQDYEPNFYGWSSKWALAENTYSQGHRTIAVLNSPELARFMTKRYRFSSIYCLPYVMNEKIRCSRSLVPIQARERRVLFYGRPSAHRNCFEVLVDGISLWQSRNPTEAAKWEIVSLGEEYPAERTWSIQNIRVLGKVSLDDYAGLLSTSMVGLSLMISPHPSYPPLEMAAFGLVTITNGFEEKDLREYSDRIISIDAVSVDLVADALEVATALAVRKQTTVFGLRPSPLLSSVKTFESRTLADEIHAQISTLMTERDEKRQRKYASL